MNEWRKHSSQMNKSEKQIIRDFVSNGKKYNYTKHAELRKSEKNIADIEVARCISYNDIIEFHFVDDSKRVLLRGKNTENGYHVCVVVDLDTHDIITVYKNRNNDNHFTLDESEYDKSYNLLDYIKEIE